MNLKSNLPAILLFLYLVLIYKITCKEIKKDENENKQNSVLENRLKRGLQWKDYYSSYSPYSYPRPAINYNQQRNPYYYSSYPYNYRRSYSNNYYNPDRYDGPIKTSVTPVKSTEADKVVEVKEKRKKKKLFVPNVWG